MSALDNHKDFSIKMARMQALNLEEIHGALVSLIQRIPEHERTQAEAVLFNKAQALALKEDQIKKAKSNDALSAVLTQQQQ